MISSIYLSFCVCVCVCACACVRACVHVCVCSSPHDGLVIIFDPLLSCPERFYLLSIASFCLFPFFHYTPLLLLHTQQLLLHWTNTLTQRLVYTKIERIYSSMTVNFDLPLFPAQETRFVPWALLFYWPGSPSSGVGSVAAAAHSRNVNTHWLSQSSAHIPTIVNHPPTPHNHTVPHSWVTL